MGKKALFAALTIASASSWIATEAFQPSTMVASFGAGRASKTDLNVVAYGRDQETKANIEIEKPIDNHGYIVNNERSFWLHALQNLEPTSSSSANESLWAKIACAYGPKELRETSIRKRDADLVRVGDTNLDITLAVPSDSWNPSSLETNETVVSIISGRGNRQLVTIRVDFPEGSSFDKECFTFEDELTAVIGQVRLLEQTAEHKLSKLNQ